MCFENLNKTTKKCRKVQWKTLYTLPGKLIALTFPLDVNVIKPLFNLVQGSSWTERNTGYLIFRKINPLIFKIRDKAFKTKKLLWRISCQIHMLMYLVKLFAI